METKERVLAYLEEWGMYPGDFISLETLKKDFSLEELKSMLEGSRFAIEEMKPESVITCIVDKEFPPLFQGYKGTILEHFHVPMPLEELK